MKLLQILNEENKKPSVMREMKAILHNLYKDNFTSQMAWNDKLAKGRKIKIELSAGMNKAIDKNGEEKEIAKIKKAVEAKGYDVTSVHFQGHAFRGVDTVVIKIKNPQE